MRKTLILILIALLAHSAIPTPASAAVYLDLDPVSITNGTETTIATWQVNQNQFGQGFKIECYGRVNSKAAPAGNLTLRFRSNGSVFSSTVLSLPANLSQEVWKLDVLATVEGLSESAAYLDCTGKIELVSSTVNGQKVLPVAIPPTVDLTQNPTFSVTLQFGTSNAGNNAVREKGVVSLL